MNFNAEGFVRIGERTVTQILNYLCRRFDSIYCHNQNLCMNTRENVKHNRYMYMYVFTINLPTYIIELQNITHIKLDL